MLFSCSVGYRANASKPFFGQSLSELLASEGRLFLFQEQPPGSTTPPTAGPAPTLLESNGFTVTEILEQDLERTRVGGIMAEKRMPG